MKDGFYYITGVNYLKYMLSNSTRGFLMVVLVDVVSTSDCSTSFFTNSTDLTPPLLMSTSILLFLVSCTFESLVPVISTFAFTLTVFNNSRKNPSSLLALTARLLKCLNSSLCISLCLTDSLLGIFQ